MTKPIFEPVPSGGDWRRNVVVQRHDDYELAVGFAALTEVVVEDWKNRGANDLLFAPLLFNMRHAFELMLKTAVRRAAARLGAAGDVDAGLGQSALDKELTVGHNLGKLAKRFDELAARLRAFQLEIETLPPAVLDVIDELDTLDPGGDAFRYSKVKVNKALADAPRPLLTSTTDLHAHVDVVALEEHFVEAFNLLGGAMSMLDQIAEYQEFLADERVP